VLTVPVAGTSAQFASLSTNGLSYEVNIPSSTASGNGKTIFFQLKAPSGTQWIGLGQGSSMVGANIFMVYTAGDGNVTLSPRSSIGHTQPTFNSAAKVSLLEGSGVLSDGSMVANVRCDSCLSWNGGSMSPTDPNSAWIWSYRTGDRLIHLTLLRIFCNMSRWAVQRSTCQPGLEGAPPTHLSLQQPILARLHLHQGHLHQDPHRRQYQLKLSAQVQSLYL
jgi:hypothetical protein